MARSGGHVEFECMLDEGWRRVSATTGYLSEREARFLMAAAALSPAEGKNLEFGLNVDPQVAVWQKPGVANSSAVGLPDFSASSRLIWYIAGSISVPDDRWLRSGVSLTVGVLTEIAGLSGSGCASV